MKLIDDNTILQRYSDVLKTNVDDEMVLMSIEEGKYFAANSVAKVLWDLLEKPMSFAAVCQKAEVLFDVSKTRNYRDEISEFFKILIDQKLVKIISKGDA